MGPTQTLTAVITRGDGGPLKLTMAPVIKKGLDVRLREIEPGERYELLVTLAPPLDSGSIRETVRFETGVPEASKAKLIISAHIPKRVETRPRRIKIPRRRRADWKQTLRLQWDDQHPAKILGAATDDPGLIAEVVGEEGKQRVILKVLADYELKPGIHTLTIKTADTFAPEVTVSIQLAPANRGPKAQSVAGRSRKAARKVGPKAKPTLARRRPPKSATTAKGKSETKTEAKNEPKDTAKTPARGSAKTKTKKIPDKTKD